MWESAFGKSPVIKWLKEQVDALLAAAGFSEIDITSKIDKPASFPVGNFATFNSESGTLEETDFNGESFVPVEEGKGLSANDFTDEYKSLLDNLPEVPAYDGEKMNVIEATAGNIDTIILQGADGQPYASGIKIGGIPATLSQGINSDTAYPSVVSFSTGISVVDTAISAHVYYGMSIDTVTNRKRTGYIIALFNGTDTPEMIGDRGGDGIGIEITGDIYFTVVNNILICNYNITDADFAHRITLNITIL